MPTVAIKPTADANPLRAVVLMLLGVGLFSLMDAGLKLLSPHYPPLQIAALRGLSSLPWVLTWATTTVGIRSLLRARWSLHLLRGVIGVGMMVGFVIGLRTLPLSTAYSISFVAPLLITAMSVPILHEQVGPRRWFAVVVGLIGVLVVLRPSTMAWSRSAAWPYCWPRLHMPRRRSPCGCWRAPTATSRWWCG